MHFIRLAGRLLATLMVAAAILLPVAAEAQEQQRLSGDFATLQAAISNMVRDADTLEAQLRGGALDDAMLVEVRNRLEEIGRQVLARSVAFGPRLQEINTRLDQIGPPPAEGQPAEPPQLTDERAALQSEKAQINAVLGEAENLSVRASRLVDDIAQIRRDLFASQFSKRYDVTSALGSGVLAEFRDEISDLYGRFASWYRYIVRFKLNAVLAASFFSVAVAAVLLIGGRRVFGGLIRADPSIDEPSYLNRLSVAFWSTLLPSAALTVFLAANYFLLQYYGVLREDIASILATLFNVIATVFFINRLARAAFAPARPKWRLVPVETRAASLLFWLVWATSIVTGADFVLTKVNEVLGSPLSLTIAKSLMATIIVGVLLILIGLVKPFSDTEGRPRGWHWALRYPMIGLGVVMIVAAVFGYIGLARFLSQQVVITGGILATMYIGHLSARALSDFGAFTKTSLGRRLDRAFSFDESTEDQLGLGVSIVIHLVVLLIGVPLILLQWGFQWGDVTTWALSIAREIRIGSVSFSLIGILTGVLVFIMGYFVTRWFQSWLDGSVMTRGRVDAGVRNSIRTVVGYLGLAVAALIGISAAGIDLSNLALIAGGLSLGIGFGLQNIVQNFVSGLILLAERPFKAGDWIVAGPISGTVKKISVRATEIETFQKQTVILPNSELINAAVGNWTHRNKLGRVEIGVGVAYEADPRKVHAVLTEIVTANEAVLKNPAPMVVFTNFADSSLNFEMRFFLADITAQLAVQNEMRFAIHERFRAEGIEIPFPKRDINVSPHVMEALRQLRAAEPAKPPRGSRSRRPK